MSNFDSRKLRAENFVHNNGVVLRTINILQIHYNKLSGIQRVLDNDGISEGEFLESVNFLSEEGYIRLRHIASKTNCLLADNDYKELEAILTGKGIRLTKWDIKDNLIEM